MLKHVRIHILQSPVVRIVTQVCLPARKAFIGHQDLVVVARCPYRGLWCAWHVLFRALKRTWGCRISQYALHALTCLQPSIASRDASLEALHQASQMVSLHAVAPLHHRKRLAHLHYAMDMCRHAHMVREGHVLFMQMATHLLHLSINNLAKRR